MAYEKLNQPQALMWGTGPYQRITETIPDIHELIVERLTPRPDRRRLDLACGRGAVAERAAARGAALTGIDLAPALIRTARERAAEVGLEIDYRVGDCEGPPHARAPARGQEAAVTMRATQVSRHSSAAAPRG